MPETESSLMGFKSVHQKDSMMCGAACLASICKYYGQKYSLDFIDTLCHSTKEGVSMKSIEMSARHLGFDVRAGLVPFRKLQDMPLPAILHWNQNHFVILYKINKKFTKFYVSDPGKCNIEYRTNEFRDKWISSEADDEPKGIAMFLLPTKDFGKVKENRDKHNSLKFLSSYIASYRKYFFYIVLGLLLGCMLQLVLPFLTQWIVDIGIRHKDIKLIWLILLGELMIVAGKTVTNFIRQWLLLHISMRVNISLVSDFFVKLLKLPMAFFDTKLMGDLLQRIGDHSRVQEFLTSRLLSVTFSFLSFFVFGIVLLIYNTLIFSIFIAGSVVYGIWITIFLHRRKALDYELFECEARNQNKTYRFITSIQEIKLQDCERRRRWEWEDVQADLFDVRMKSLHLQQTQEAGAVFINEMKNIVITVLAATAVINGSMTLGAMLAVQYIIGQLNSPMEQLMSFIYSVQDVKISLERIGEVHLSRNEEPEENRAEEYGGGKYIDIKNVEFKYDPNAKAKALENVSLHIPQGKITAIVGSSGSGKTTLIKLMLGYYPVNSGLITVAGRNITDYNMKWWRRHCGVVMQEGVIFSDSIARNIAIADEDIDEERLYTAARIANIHDYIMKLPLKYNTNIGPDGVGLSQGQKQRILIARAVYKNPDFIFLDEATNSLDASNERAIVENLQKFYKGKTVVVVAHRLSTVRNADNIVVLDSGRVVETGHHDSLINKRGAYYKLIKNQLELGN